MQSLEIIRSYLKQREKSISDLLKSKKKKNEAENFHQLRLEIKKTRAALGLLSSCTSSIDLKKKMSPYLSLFKQAGKIRELQLHKSYLNKHSAPDEVPVYSKTIDQLTSAEIKRFSALKNQKEIKALGHKSDMLRVEPLQIDENSLEDSIEKEQKNILKLLVKAKLKVPQVHDLRKRIKSFYFLNSLLPVKKKKLKHLNGFQELLGKWHDYEVFGEELQKANKLQHLPVEEKKKLRKLKPKVFRKQEALFKKIDKSRFALVKN